MPPGYGEERFRLQVEPDTGEVVIQLPSRISLAGEGPYDPASCSLYGLVEVRNRQSEDEEVVYPTEVILFGQGLRHQTYYGIVAQAFPVRVLDIVLALATRGTHGPAVFARVTEGEVTAIIDAIALYATPMRPLPPNWPAILQGLERAEE